MAAGRAELLAGYDFQLDPFQVRALDALDAGRSVLVAAPTGSGKTVVAEYAVARALAEGGKAFYTAPIKALSNQKYTDIARRHGTDRVGLLTGDNAINGDAPVVVMTTEVLRNMIYAASPALRGLRYVVLDEVHFLQDAYRGQVWEEVIVHLPAAVRLVCLSATVSNAEELAEWITTVRGTTDAVIEERRPVELQNLYCVGDKRSQELHLLPTLVDGRPNPEAERLDDEALHARGRPQRGRPRRRFFTPRRIEVIELLAEHGMLPAITFIFSRRACDEARDGCLDAGLRLTNPDERARVRAIVADRLANLADSDLDVLGFDRFLAGLEAGVAAHHAGMVPPFKEAVEACFTEGLTKAVFATETLALGVNMPARSVVIERLTKFSGERRELLTPGEYTQLTGRAGRRGIDEVGHAVVLWSPFVPFEQVASLASSRTYALRSAFRPTYNMAANLVRRYEPAEAHHLLNLSFAQYQADRAVVRLESRIDRQERRLERLRAEATCELGDVEEYRRLRREADGAARGRRAAPREADGAGRARRAMPAGAKAAEDHPVAACPDRQAHLRAAVQAERVERDLHDLRRQVRGRTESLARRFDRVLRLLEAWDYLDGWSLTKRGHILAGTYHEADLLVAEALASGLLDDLDAPSLAALVSCLTYEHRGREQPPAPRFASSTVRDRFRRLEELAADLNADEEVAGLPTTRPPDPGFVHLAHAWAAGGGLASVLEDEELSGGDFVRNVKQLIDLLGGIADVAPAPATAVRARQAAEALQRGVVTATSALELGEDEAIHPGDAPGAEGERADLEG